MGEIAGKGGEVSACVLTEWVASELMGAPRSAHGRRIDSRKVMGSL